MASVDYKKIHGPTASKRVLRHIYSETRVRDNHSNEDIDKQYTDQNSVIYDKIPTYEAACALYDSTFTVLDSKPKANRRKDRVTAFGLNIPIPPAITEQGKAAEDDFARDCTAALQQQYSESVLLCSVLHRDEVHDYLDAESGAKRRSRPHLHLVFIPIQKGRLYGKGFSHRTEMHIANRHVEEIAGAYGTFFMTGEKRKSRRSMAELKALSTVRQAEAEAERSKKQAKLKEKAASQKEEKARKELQEAAAIKQELEMERQVAFTRADLLEVIAEDDAEQAAAEAEEMEQELERQLKALEEREKAVAAREQEQQRLIAYGRRYEADMRAKDFMTDEAEDEVITSYV